MNDYILLMHDDVPEQGQQEPPLDWQLYLANLRDSGCFSGGSSIGEGVCLTPGLVSETRHR